MARHVYLVVTDLHLYYKNLSSRKNYLAELDVARQKIEELCEKYDRPTILFLGDIFHSGYQSVTQAISDISWFGKLKEITSGLYTVVGNHELSYTKSNPFYGLICGVASSKLPISSKVFGHHGVVNVVDELIDGDTKFVFNHYGTEIDTDKFEGVKIGLFHQDLVTAQVEADNDIQVYGDRLEDTSVFSSYDYAFLGHIHSVYGLYREGRTFVDYLGSLGRTNVTEVNDKNRERDIPAVIIEDNKFSRIERNQFLLPSRAESVIEESVIANHEAYEKRKVLHEVRDMRIGNEDSIDNVRVMLKDYGGTALAIVDSAAEGKLGDLWRSVRPGGMYGF